MTFRTAAFMAGLLIAGICGNAVAQTAPTLDRDGILALHNALRAKHGTPPLTWSDALAQTSQTWANGCVFEHGKTDNGENLAQWTGDQAQTSFVQAWYDEIKDYDYATAASKNGNAIGHFTQVVWKSTTQVGCGVQACNGGTMLVCQYAPAGNFTGQYPENVPPVK